MALTGRQTQDVAAVAALAWTWMSLAGEGRPGAQASVLAAFQGQYNARLASLRAAQAELGTLALAPFAILTVDGRYGLNTARAIANASFLAGGAEVEGWLQSLPRTYNDNIIQMIWDEIARAYPTSGQTMVGRYMWQMVRSIIGVPDAQAGQVAANSLTRSVSVVNDRTAYQMTPAQFAEQLSSKVPGGGGQNLPGKGEDAQFLVAPEEGVDRSYAFDPDVVHGRRQATTNSYVIWLVLAGALGVGAIAYSRYRSEA